MCVCVCVCGIIPNLGEIIRDPRLEIGEREREREGEGETPSLGGMMPETEVEECVCERARAPVRTMRARPSDRLSVSVLFCTSECGFVP